MFFSHFMFDIFLSVDILLISLSFCSQPDTSLTCSHPRDRLTRRFIIRFLLLSISITCFVILHVLLVIRLPVYRDINFHAIHDLFILDR